MNLRMEVRVASFCPENSFSKQHSERDQWDGYVDTQRFEMEIVVSLLSVFSMSVRSSYQRTLMSGITCVAKPPYPS
jgi:hypothetical protein